MDWFQSLDTAVFRFVNLTLSNPVFDRAMPFFSWNPFFVPALLVAAALLIWKGGVRGRVCLFMLLLAVGVGDGIIGNSLKEGVGRLRPFNVITDAHVLIGRGGSGSMPSSHALNWFAAATVLFIYYRKSWRFMLPLAATVSFSRIYNGVHYPSDVIAGMFLGFGSSAGLVWIVNQIWQAIGPRWFHDWHAALPSLMNPPEALEKKTVVRAEASDKSSDVYWLRLGYIFIGVTLLAGWAYLASGKIELSEDEAYQWVWSKHLALSYFSKPPMIAYTQFLGTSLWGDNEFGVRFFSPLIAAILSFVLLRFLAREINARVGFWVVVMAAVTPMLAVGSILMTIDPLSVLFWVAAMVAGWRAVQSNSTRHWLWCGLWMAFGFLSKAASLYQLLCWAVFFILWPDARKQLKRPGPYLALLIKALGAIPVLVWNAQHNWITFHHLENRAGLEQAWTPTIKFFRDFVLQETGLLNPIFFVATIWAAIFFWKRYRRHQLMIYLFSMGAPVYILHLFLTLRSRVQPNWIAPAILPTLCLGAIYWDLQWQAGKRAVKVWLISGVALGAVAVVILHDTNLIRKISGHPLPVKMDPLVRLRGWRAMANAVEDQRQKLAKEGKPVFIIGYHYGITGLLSFYIPEAREKVREHPIVFYESSDKPLNQFYFWPGYTDRKGDNALYVREVKRGSQPEPLPERLRNEFASITDLGNFDVQYRDQVIHTVQIFACRDLH